MIFYGWIAITVAPFGSRFGLNSFLSKMSEKCRQSLICNSYLRRCKNVDLDFLSICFIEVISQFLKTGSRSIPSNTSSIFPLFLDDFQMIHIFSVEYPYQFQKPFNYTFLMTHGICVEYIPMNSIAVNLKHHSNNNNNGYLDV